MELLRMTAFPDGPDGGNPAGVALHTGGLDDAAMLALAAEVRFSETAFVVNAAVGADPRHLAVRYFSPTAEVPFCGHVTIATAVVVAQRLGAGPLAGLGAQPAEGRHDVLLADLPLRALWFDTPAGGIEIATSSRDGATMAAFTSVSRRSVNRLPSW